jgi:peptide/nickel transport system permease protein
MSAVLAPQPDEWRSGFTGRRFAADPMSWVGLALLTFVLCALVAAVVIGVVDPHAAAAANLRNAGAPLGSPGHLLGTDLAGRDVLVRVIVATRATMSGVLLALAVALGIGMPAGLVAGYHGGWVDGVLNWLSSTLMSLPALVVLMATITSLGTSMWVTMSALGVVMAPSMFRLARSQVIAVRREPYVDAAIVSGLGDVRILAHHVLPVVRGPLILMTSLLASAAVTVQTGLDFVGLGDQSTVTWGGMLSEGLAGMSADPWLFVWPGLAMALTNAAFLLVANGVRDALEVSHRHGDAPRRRPRAGALTVVTPGGEDARATAFPELLVVRDLTIAYPKFGGLTEVVREASLTLSRGKTLGLVGESGSGKTQTGYAILDLLPEDARVLGGEIWLDGVELLGLERRQRERLVRAAIAYVPQEPSHNLDPSFTVGHQLAEPLLCRGSSRRAARDLTSELLRHVGVEDPARVMSAYPHQISGGTAQRVLIAGAISSEPRVLVADEPTTALDVTVQRDLLDLLRRLQREFDMALLLVTHDLGVVADLCSDVSVMRAGRIVESASVLDFFERPRHEYSRALLGAVTHADRVRAPYAECDAADHGAGGHAE